MRNRTLPLSVADAGRIASLVQSHPSNECSPPPFTWPGSPQGTSAPGSSARRAPDLSTRARLPSPRDLALASLLANELLPSHSEGGTYDPRTSAFPQFDDEQVYLVSLPGYERRIRRTPTPDRLAEWLPTAQEASTAHGGYIGWWRDGHDTVLDVSVPIIGNRERVLVIAESWRQRAIYQPATKEVILVAPPWGGAA